MSTIEPTRGSSLRGSFSAGGEQMVLEAIRLQCASEASLMKPAKNAACDAVLLPGECAKGLVNRGPRRSKNELVQQDGVSAPEISKPRGGQSWPPAWVKLNKDNRDHYTVEGSKETAPVLAKSIFATSRPLPSEQSGAGSRAKDVDIRLLKGSAFQKALFLQQELRHDRVRRLELQRYPGRRLALLTPVHFAAAQTNTDSDNTQDRPRQTGDVTRTDTNASSGDRASLPVEAEVMPSPLQRIAASRSQANLHPLGDAGRRNEALGGTYDPPATRMATNGMTSIEESPLTPLVGLGLTNSTSKEEEGSSKRLSFQAPAARATKVLLLSCRRCHRRESALWCSDRKAAFCVPCFESLPHPLATGIAFNRDQEFPQVELAIPTEGLSAGDTRDVEGKIDVQLGCARKVGRGRLRLGRSLHFLSSRDASQDARKDSVSIELAGSRRGSPKIGTENHRASGLLKEYKVAVLPQDKLTAFCSTPVMHLSPGAAGLCSARDYHNVKYNFASAKAVASRQIPFKLGGERLHPPMECGVAGEDGVRGGFTEGVKKFGTTTVRVVTP
ncbi:unnamed protein product [Ascophyllum nodosum]